MTWPFDPKLQTHGAQFIPAAVAPGAFYWRLVVAHGPLEWGGRVSIFVDVIDEAERRLVGVPVTMWWADGSDTKPLEPKAGEPFGVDFVMGAAGNAYGIRVADGLPSDAIFGMGLVAWQPHVSYQLIFQRAIAATAPTVPAPPVDPPAPPWTPQQALDEAVRYIDLARSLL
jgi:hypothetical protein